MKNLGRILAILAGFALGAATIGGTANAGDYTVAPCSSVDSPSSVVEYVESPASNPGFVGEPNCPGGSLTRVSGATYPGDMASLKVEAPQGTGFLGVTFDSYHNPSYGGVTSRFMFNNAGGANTEVGNVPTYGEPTSWFDWFDVTDGQPRSIFRATLKCENPVDPCASGGARIGFYLPKFKIRDSLAPTAYFLGGTLFNPGTVSGMRTAQLGGIDNGGGVSAISINVNDALANWTFPTCGRAGLSPCPRDPTTTFNVNTAGSNFVNGMNKISVCVQDYAATGGTNATCDHRYINVAK
ncbi:MAG TPA: hypothetical protein VMF31_01880 [Solirubrobacterales bacterium]|nr:hypothetical protein [Solirubrobacterales bacterium]